MFGRWLAWVYDHPKRCAALWLVVVLLGVVQLIQQASVDIHMDRLIGIDHPTYQQYQQYTQHFDHDEQFMLVVRSPTLLQPSTLQQVWALQQQIHTQPEIKHIDSILNTPYIENQHGEIRLGYLMQPASGTPAQFQTRLEAILIHAPHVNMLLSADRQAMLIAINIHPPSAKQSAPAYYLGVKQALEAILAHHQQPHLSLELLGQASFMAATYQTLLYDLYVLPLLALLASMLMLWLTFRRNSSVLMLVWVVVLPVVLMMAALVGSGHPIQIPAALLPPMIIVIAVASYVHILKDFYRFYQDGVDQRTALIQAITHKQTALIATTVTTVLGLLCSMFATIEPIANIGLYGALGVALILLSLLWVMPLYVRWVPMRRQRAEQSHPSSLLNRAIAKLVDVCLHTALTYPKAMSGMAVALLVVAGVLAAQIRFEHDPHVWLPKTWLMYQQSQRAEQQFQSSVSIEVLLDSGRESGVMSADFLTRLAALEHSVKHDPHQNLALGVVVSIVDYTQQVRQMLPVATSQQDQAALIRRDFNALSLLSGRLVDQLVSPDRRYARLSIRVPMKNGQVYQPLIAAIEQQVDRYFAQTPYRVTVTGQAVILAKTYEELTASALLSYGLALLSISAMMMWHVRRWFDGVMMMIPNVLPIALVLAGLYALDRPLDVLSMLVVSIAMGIVVDDTIHLTTHFRRHLLRTNDARLSLRLAMQEVGEAMVMTTLVLILGWQILWLSSFDYIAFFGVLASCILGLGLLADLLVAPALLIWRGEWVSRRQRVDHPVD
jgi:predicted RND superfamily exporter protein